MKRASIVGCTILFLAVAGFAQSPDHAPLSGAALAAILGQPTAGPCAAAPAPTAVPAVQLATGAGSTKSLCSATANCETGTVTCSSNVSVTSCSAADRNCAAGERGHVTCNGTTTWCPTVCGICDTCYATNDCVACCRCDGGTPAACRRACIGPFVP